MQVSNSISTSLLPIARSHSLLPAMAVTIASLILMGCNQPALWDTEYSCSGQEQSSAYFVDSDAMKVIQKSYPITIDFHLRAGHAIVRSYLTSIDSKADSEFSFSAKNNYSWVSGQFDQKNGQLALVEGRVLEIAGRQQQTRTTGQYLCKKVGRTA